jgi:hypothetical protein
VQPVGAPQPRIVRHRLRREVDEDRAAARAPAAYRLVEGPHPRREVARQRHHRPEVGEGEGEHRRPGPRQAALQPLDLLGHRSGVEPAGDDVVGAGENGGQVRPHRAGERELLLPDLPGPPAAHRQVGVEHRTLQLGQALGEPVGPPAVAAGPVGVVEPLGRAVADGDVAGEAAGQAEDSSGPERVGFPPGRR